MVTLLKHYTPPEGVEFTFRMDAYENMGLIPLGKFFFYFSGRSGWDWSLRLTFSGAGSALGVHAVH